MGTPKEPNSEQSIPQCCECGCTIDRHTRVISWHWKDKTVTHLCVLCADAVSNCLSRMVSGARDIAEVEANFARHEAARNVANAGRGVE